MRVVNLVPVEMGWVEVGVEWVEVGVVVVQCEEDMMEMGV